MRGEEKKEYLRRVCIFAVIQILIFLVIIWRLAYLQIYKASQYTLLSDKNRISTEIILPDRGQIRTRKCEIIAKNIPIYSVVLDISDKRQDEISSLMQLVNDYVGLHDLRTQKKNGYNKKYNIIETDLNWCQVAKYSVLSIKIPELKVEKHLKRIYNYPYEFSHIAGYVGSPARRDIEESENSAMPPLPFAKVGKTGIEKQYNTQLCGIAGLTHNEVNSRRRFIREIDHIAPISGTNIQLTIDIKLQKEVYKILSKYESASCIVMNANNGDILAIVSYPGYDVNIFSKHIDKQQLNKLYNSPFNAIINKVISGIYAPGSVFKMVTALAGLKKGIINENTRFNCHGYIEIGKHKFHCWKWKSGGHGSVDLEDALAESCDVYFYNVAKMISPDDIAKVAKDFGLGELTGIDLPNEKSGLIPTKSWKKETKKQKWTTGDTLNMSIGQGFVLTTPIQLAKMMAILVNGQNSITPHLNKEYKTNNEKRLGYSKNHIRIIQNGMNAVVNSWYGTAKQFAIDDENFKFGGKTGSSQVVRISEKLRKLGKTVSDDYWKKEHAVFVGYAPVENPKIIVSVLIEHGGSGGHTAASVAHDVFLATKEFCPEFYSETNN